VKKYISILLCSILIFNTTLYFVLIPFLIDSLKERFDDEESEEIYEISRIFEVYDNKPHDFIFIDKKEIKADGDMFDILKVERKEGKTVYYCYHDKEEDNILKNLWDNPLNKGNRQKHNIQLRPLAPFVVQGINIDCYNLQNNGTIPGYITQHLQMIYYDIATPPPNLT